MAAADWSAAITTLMQIQTRLATTPNIERQLAGGGSQKVGWNASTISDLIANCRRNAASASVANSTVGPWQTTKVKYKRAT